MKFQYHASEAKNTMAWDTHGWWLAVAKGTVTALRSRVIAGKREQFTKLLVYHSFITVASLI